MTEALQIGRLALHAQDLSADDARLLRDGAAHWTALDGDALARRWVDAESWLLIRRLPMALPWHASQTDGQTAMAFEQALSQAIEQAVAQGEASCLRFAHRRAALADLLMRAAQRDSSRHWAWQRMGWLPRADLSPDEVLARGLAALATEPALAWPVLRRLLAGEACCASLSALLRMLSLADWQQWLALAPQSAPWAAAVARPLPSAPGPVHRAAPHAPEPAAARELRQWCAQRPAVWAHHAPLLSALLAALRHEGRRPSAAQADLAWQLAAADLAPQGLPAPRPPRRDTMPAPGPAITHRAATPGASPAEPAPQPVAAARRAAEPGPDLPEPARRLSTQCGGALFWLARAVAAALPMLDATTPLPLYLLALGRALGLPDQEPALDAFCGGERPADEPDESLLSLAAAQARAWEDWLAQSAPDLPAPRLAAVCRRHGALSIEPGWIELHLPLDSVDIRVRRLGLDLDPGWIAPLACVLRIRYDD